MRYGSVCTGISAATAAWASLGMHPAWFAEIEAKPSIVLRHRYPHVPNLGDMTKIAAAVRAGVIEAPDILEGGTPCQAFSVAGLRAGLQDPRGQLTLAYVDLLNAIDEKRPGNECIAVWENVPGVLNDKSNAFGCFLGLLAGEDCALVPAGKSWTNAGCVYGPQRAIAWRVFDAQYFGVAQRRRRVFVVASARAGFDPTAILFESQGVRRDIAPSRGKGKNTTAGTLRSTDGGCDVTHATGGHLQAVTGTLSARAGGGGLGTDFECAGGLQAVAGTLTATYGEQSGRDLAEMPGGLQLAAFGGNNQSGPIDVATACRAHGSMHQDFESETFIVTPPIAFDSRQDCVSSAHVFGALGSSSPQAQAVCTYGSREVAGALTSSYGKQPDGSDTALGPNLAICVTGQITHTLKAEGFDASEDGTGRGQPIVATIAGTLGANHGNVKAEHAWTGQLAAVGMAVRRLTPRECERLQGFPDDYTRVAGLADGPRYKALGNSMAVPCMRWIGRRILSIDGLVSID